MALTISSSAFSQGDEIPKKYSCEGEDIAPPLHWQGVPAGARSLVLIVEDPDAPDPAAPKMTWTHWVLFNLPPDSTGVPEGTGHDDLPPATDEGLNDWQHTGYGGPCPPIGRHRYFFRLYALDSVLSGLGDKPVKGQVRKAMQGHILAEAELMGTYRKANS